MLVSVELMPSISRRRRSRLALHLDQHDGAHFGLPGAGRRTLTCYATRCDHGKTSFMR